MIFRLAPSVGKNRNESFKAKNHSNNYPSQEELDNLRSKSTTPKKILKSLPKNDSLIYPTKFPLNHPLFDSLNPQKPDFKHNISLADIRLMNYISSPSKPSQIQDPRKPFHKNIEEKSITPIKGLQKEKFLKEPQRTKQSQREGLKAKQSSVLKNLKMISVELEGAVSVFVKKIKEEIEKICFLMLEKDIKIEVFKMKEAFNEGLDGLAEVIGGKVQKWRFVNDAEEGDLGRMRMTGKFVSANQSKGDWKDEDTKKVVKEVVAMSGFKASDYGQLDFSPGDRIQVLKIDDSEWWLGKIGEKVGRIPSQLVMLD